MRLENKTVVVTGASAGMGAAIAQRFVEEGANVVAVARRLERLEELAESVKDAPGKLVPCQGDISNPETSQRMIDLAVKTFARLDVLVNNAGIMDDNTAVGDVSDEMIDRLFRVNIYGPLYAMRQAVRAFLAQGDEGGNIINIASVGAAHTITYHRKGSTIRQTAADKGVLVVRPYSSGIGPANHSHGHSSLPG